MRRHRLRLTPLTPIHIGTGEEFGPLEYCLRTIPGSGRSEYARFDLNRLMARLARAEPALAARISDHNDLRAIVADVHTALRDEDVLYRTAVTPDFADRYRSKLADPGNQLLVGAMARDALTGGPMIPGSSLKGAIRTALVSRWGRDKKPDGFRPDETQLIGNRGPQDDPLRALRLADTVFTCRDADFVGEVLNFSRSLGACSSIQLIREQIAGLDWGNPETETALDLDDRLMQTRPGGVSRSIAIEEIASACREFYMDKARSEHARFYSRRPGDAAEADRCYGELLARLEKAPANTFPVRLGRYSHFESVTLDVHRSTRQRSGGSRALSDGLLPMGWLEVEVLPS